MQHRREQLVALLRALPDDQPPGPLIRAAIVDDEECVTMLVRMLHAPRRVERLAAAELLGRATIGRSRAAEALVSLFHDEDDDLAGVAASAFARLGPASGHRATDVIGLLQAATRTIVASALMRALQWEMNSDPAPGAATVLSLARSFVGRSSSARAFAAWRERGAAIEPLAGQSHRARFDDEHGLAAETVRALGLQPRSAVEVDVLFELMHCAADSVASAAIKCIEQYAWTDELTDAQLDEVLFKLENSEPPNRARSLAWIRERHRGNLSLAQRALSALVTLDDRLVLPALGALERLGVRGPALVDALTALLDRTPSDSASRAALRATLIRLDAYAPPRGERALRDLLVRVTPLPWLVQACGARFYQGRIFVPTSMTTSRAEHADEPGSEQFAMTSIDPSTGAVEHVPMTAPLPRVRVGPMRYREMAFESVRDGVLVVQVRAIAVGTLVLATRFAFDPERRTWMQLDSMDGEPNEYPGPGSFGVSLESARREVRSDVNGRWIIEGWPDLIDVNESLRAAVPSIGPSATAMLCDAVEFVGSDGAVSLALPANVANSAGPRALLVVLHTAGRALG